MLSSSVFDALALEDMGDTLLRNVGNQKPWYSE